MEPTLVKKYLRALERELRWRGLTDPETLAEIESHLLDSVEQGIRWGLSPEEAQRQALERFGPARWVAKRFGQERHGTMQKILFVVAVIVGILIAFVDTRPTWDDTGITVFSLLLSSGLIGLLIQRRPWLYGLAVGVWLPLWYIVKNGDVRMLVVLAIPLAGVYAGWGFRKFIHFALHPA